jgi:hypothetical protein
VQQNRLLSAQSWFDWLVGWREIGSDALFKSSESFPAQLDCIVCWIVICIIFWIWWSWLGGGRLVEMDCSNPRHHSLLHTIALFAGSSFALFYCLLNHQLQCRAMWRSLNTSMLLLPRGSWAARLNWAQEKPIGTRRSVSGSSTSTRSGTKRQCGSSTLRPSPNWEISSKLLCMTTPTSGQDILVNACFIYSSS